MAIEHEVEARARRLEGTGIPLVVLRDERVWRYFLEHGHVLESGVIPAFSIDELDLASLVRLEVELRLAREQRPRFLTVALRARLVSSPGIEIIRAVEIDPFLFKSAHAELEARDADAGAARAIVEAHDAGRMASWRAAALLGAVRDRAGYEKAIEILLRGDRLLSESYAAHALWRIAGAACERDLARVIDEVDDGLARRAAATVLGGIASDSALAFLLSAVERGRLRALSVARGLVGVSVDPEWLLVALGSEHREVRRIVPMLLAERIRVHEKDETVARELDRCGASKELRTALASVLGEGVETVWDADRRAIEERWA